MPARIDLSKGLLQSLREENHSVIEIAKIIGASEPTVRKRMIEFGIPRLPAKARPGPFHKWWKGGRTVDKSGYILVSSPTHPNKNHAGYVFEHRLILEKYLNRYLLTTEVVHHRDEDRKNNSIENLQLFEKNSDHLQKTLRGKCPNWTAAGREKTLRGVQRWRREQLSIQKKIEAYAKLRGLTAHHLLDRLTPAGRDLLRTGLKHGKPPPLDVLRKKHGKISRSQLYRRRKKMSRRSDQKF